MDMATALTEALIFLRSEGVESSPVTEGLRKDKAWENAANAYLMAKADYEAAVEAMREAENRLKTLHDGSDRAEGYGVSVSFQKALQGGQFVVNKTG